MNVNHLGWTDPSRTGFMQPQTCAKVTTGILQLAILAIVLFASPHATEAYGQVDKSSLGTHDADVANAFQVWLDAECKRHPVFSTQQGNREYDGQMDDLSPKARAEDAEDPRTGRRARE